jgi:hypothetical protein
MSQEDHRLPTGLRAKIVALTAFLVALGALLDASVALFTKIPSVTCRLEISLPWCSAPGDNLPPVFPKTDPTLAPKPNSTPTVPVQTNPTGQFISMAGALDQSRWRKRAGNGDYQFAAGELEVSTYKGSVLMAADDSTIRKDFIYSIRTKLISGPTQLGFGLVFGMQDPDNYFLFAKRTAGDYRLTQRQDGRERVILPWTNSTFITAVTSPQTLQVVSEGKFVTLLADGHELQTQSVDLGQQPVGSVGLFVDSPGLHANFSEISFGPRN